MIRTKISGAHVCFNDNAHPMAFPTSLLLKEEMDCQCTVMHAHRETVSPQSYGLSAQFSLPPTSVKVQQLVLFIND